MAIVATKALWHVSPVSYRPYRLSRPVRRAPIAPCSSPALRVPSPSPPARLVGSPADAPSAASRTPCPSPRARLVGSPACASSAAPPSVSRVEASEPTGSGPGGQDAVADVWGLSELLNPGLMSSLFGAQRVAGCAVTPTSPPDKRPRTHHSLPSSPSQPRSLLQLPSERAGVHRSTPKLPAATPTHVVTRKAASSSGSNASMSGRRATGCVLCLGGDSWQRTGQPWRTAGATAATARRLGGKLTAAKLSAQRQRRQQAQRGCGCVAAVSMASPPGPVAEPEPGASDSGTGAGEAAGTAEERVGVLLLNLGGPDTLDDVQPFLFNLFADPDIIRLPRALRFLQRPIAQFISTMRAPKSQEGYAAIGGGSPLRRITMDQAEELGKALQAKEVAAKVYVGMRYWHPFTEEAIYQIKQDRITRLVVLPLYPQFSITTSGSSLRLLERIFREDEYLVTMQHTVIPSWYQRRGYVEAMATLIEKELVAFSRPEIVNIFFSAHGVPVAYVEEAGDPYKAEMEECVGLVMDELRRRGVYNNYTLAYQSRVGPVEWLKPYTDESIETLGKAGVKSLLAVPISFVSEHIETLEEIDMEYRELALASGVVEWGRVPALGCEPSFIEDLADAVLEALPYVGAMAASSIEARQALVPLGSVEELLATYDIERRELPAPVAMWEWGWTKSAETWNGRAAMVAVLGLLLLEVSTGRGILHQLGILPPLL
ncbi:unnamed protein product [Closterium sp. NIES-64]|nr:unnamed protein product [Closterium sp. NIES-64]